MLKCTFNTVEELREFLIDSDYGETKFCVEPDYINAIIGISDEGMVVYDYDKMAEHLAAIYENEGDIDDPYESAVESTTPELKTQGREKSGKPHKHVARLISLGERRKRLELRPRPFQITCGCSS